MVPVVDVFEPTRSEYEYVFKLSYPPMCVLRLLFFAKSRCRMFWAKRVCLVARIRVCRIVPVFDVFNEQATD